MSNGWCVNDETSLKFEISENWTDFENKRLIHL